MTLLYVRVVARFAGAVKLTCSMPAHCTIPILDKRIIALDLEVNWAISRSLVLQAGLAEDQFHSDRCSADVSFFLNLTGRL